MRGPQGNGSRPPGADALTIRIAQPDDARGLTRLAQRDSSMVPEGTLLVAEQDGEIRVALPIGSGEPIADPFRRTATIVHMLRVAARATAAGVS